MPRKGENIFKRKDGRWEGRYIKYHENGRAVYGYVFGKTYLEAKRKKAEAKSSVRPKTNQPLMKDIAVQWLEELKPTRKKSTIAKYDGQLRNHIIPAFGNKRISVISNENLISFSQTLLKRLSPKTVSDILSRLKSIRKFALLHGYEVKFSPECFSVPQKPNKIRVLTLEEENSLVKYLKENFNPTSLGILVALFTGVRLGELCALKWSDFNGKELHVSRTMQRLPNPDRSSAVKTVIDIGEPKSQSSIRTIPIPDQLLEYLHPVENAYLLSGYKNYFIEPRTMENRFKSILKQCGIREANFHALRHTFATRCVEVGFDIKSLSEILGHASVSITLNRYVHPTMSLKRENMNKLNELIRTQNSGL